MSLGTSDEVSVEHRPAPRRWRSVLGLVRFPNDPPHRGRGRHVAFLGLAAAAVAALLVLTSRATFALDEWYFIGRPGYGPGINFNDPAAWFQPANEHFAAVHEAVYSGLLAVFGTSTYLPYIGVLIAAHVAFVAALYVLTDRHVGRRPALAVAAIGLFLGAGYFDLFSAFQMGFVGALAFATWGVVVIRDRPVLAAILLSLGVATQGTALFLVPAAALYGRSRRSLLVAAVPVAVYGAWYVAIGHTMLHRGEAPTLVGWVQYVVGGLKATATATTGLGRFGVVVVLFAAIAMARRVPAPAVVGVSALLTEYAVLGLSRQGFSDPGVSRYIYPACMFLLLMLASAWPALPRAVKPAAALIAATAFASNALTLAFQGLYGWPAYIAAHAPH